MRDGTKRRVPTHAGRRALAGIALAGTIAGWAGCSRIDSAEGGGGAVLMRNLLRARAIEIVVAPGPAEAACWRAAERIARERRVECRVIAPAQKGDPHAVRILVTGPDSVLGAAVVGRMGLRPDATPGKPFFRWRATTFADPADAIVAVVEDPERPGLPLTLLYGNDEKELAAYVENLEPGWKPSFLIHRRRDPRIEAPLALSGAVDESRLVSRNLVRLAETRGYVTRADPGDGITVEHDAAIAEGALASYLDAVARARVATRAWAGPAGGLSPIRLFLHARPEALEACIAGALLADTNPVTGEVHALVAPDVPDDAGRAVARSTAEDLLGPAATPWIADGATAYAAGAWFGRDLEEWSAWLRAGGLAPTVAALVDAQATETTSLHLVVPLRAALFHFLLEGRGVDFVRGLWTGKEVLRVDADLDRNFGRWLDDAAAPLRAAIGERHVQRRAALLGGSFLAAVGMEEPSPVPDRGFGSEAFLRSLADARSIGANAVAFTCYAVAERDPLPLPDLAPGARARRAIGPTCGDLRLFAAACQTRGQSMRTLFQPRWLTAPGGSLAGTGPQEGEVGWKRFFDGYERFVVHFALLAELAGADGLSLGGGLTASTSASDGGWRSSSEEVGWRREGWRRVVRAARAAFSGSITWAADSVVDATGVAFWEDLDLVACDLQADYDAHGTSFHASPVMQMSLEYSTQIEALERICEARRLPLLLTQVGFRSGMPEPGAPRSGVLTRSDGLQAMQFSALGTVLAQARERDVLRGAVLWRWSTDPADAGASPRDGLIRTGPAREAVARILSSR